MIGGYSKLSFFNNEYWVGHLWKVSRDFFKYLKLSEVEADKRNCFILKPQVKCRNISPVNHQWPKLIISLKPNDSTVCEKFQMIPIPYDDFLDEDS